MLSPRNTLDVRSVAVESARERDANQAAQAEARRGCCIANRDGMLLLKAIAELSNLAAGTGPDTSHMSARPQVDEALLPSLVVL